MRVTRPLRKAAGKVLSTLRQLRVRAAAEARLLTGGEAPIRSEDRRLLEAVIIPHFVGRDDVRRVLFVGNDWYTHHYRRLFAGTDYWTLDYDPRKRRYGGPRHVVDALENVESHFEPGSLDLIVCNGVVGWGLDRLDDAERAFAACRACLRPGGYLVYGWNDRPENRPFPRQALTSLEGFERYALPDLGEAHKVDDASHHTFEFFRRPSGG